MTGDYPKRGEVWLVNFNPSIGGEIQKTRPAIIVSNNMFNKVSNRLQVIPLSSKVDRLYPSEMYITFNNIQGKAMADQLTTASKDRLIKKLGTANKDDMKGVDRIICLHLGLEHGGIVYH